MNNNNDFYDTNAKVLNKGKLTCDKNILSSIILLATKEINGVAGIANDFKGRFISIFSKKNVPGVRVKFVENGFLVVDVFIVLENGFSVPDVAYRVQENIKSNVASMIDTPVKKINVNIVGVTFAEDKLSD